MAAGTALNPYTSSSFTFSKLCNQNKIGAGWFNGRLDHVKDFSTCHAPTDVYNL
jgi:hypothetical protein